MRIALATCSNLPDWEVDDEPLRAAFRGSGVETVEPPWDDAGFDWGGCDACLIRTTWDYELRLDEYLAWAERAAFSTRLFNPLPVVRWNTHKSYLWELAERGVEVVPALRLERGSEPDLERLLAERGWRRGFLKPLVGSTARATLRFHSDPAGLEAARRHLRRRRTREEMMLQPYLESVESEGEISVILIDGEITHAVRKVPPPGDWRTQDDFGARDERLELSPGELARARSIVATAEGIIGTRGLLYARVDLLRGPGGELLLTELELVEPSLFFRHAPEAAERLAAALLARL